MDDITDGVITPLVKVEPILKKKFMPWHKPRKQWCRFNQWYNGMNWVIDTVGADRLGAFKYLGLPGDDLLDLRLFAYGCKSKSVELKYLGFNSVNEKSNSSTELNVSESELHKTGVISTGSKVITEPLETLSNKSSSAFSDADAFCGFHMVNLDLCKSIAKVGADNSRETLKSLYNILEQQLNYMREPWVLYITTHVSKASVVEEVMIPLLQVINENNESYVEFAQNLEEKVLLTPEVIRESIDNLESLSEDEFLDCFALGLSKSILKVVMGINSWKIEMTESCKYRTGDTEGIPDMLSLGYRFTYVHQVASDTYNLAGMTDGTPFPSELDFALALIEQVEQVFNLDARVNQDPALNQQLIDHSASLLETARYERDEYISWVKNGCPSKCDA